MIPEVKKPEVVVALIFLHDIQHPWGTPDRKIYVNKVLKAFLENRKCFESKPEVETHFFKISVLDLVGKSTQIVHLLPLNDGYIDFKHSRKTGSKFHSNRKSIANFSYQGTRISRTSVIYWH